MNDSNRDAASEKRVAPRQDVDPLEITSFTSLDHMTLLSRTGYLVEASKTGFCVRIKRDDLVPQALRESLSLQMLEGDRVMLTITKMGLEIAGTIKRTGRRGKDMFEFGVDYSADAPEYWRECLLDLLPRPGELTEE